MVHTRTSEDPILDIPEGSVGHGHGKVPRNNASPPPPHLPVSLEQLLVHTRTSKDPILNIPEGSVGRGRGKVPSNNAPPPPPHPPPQ
jgi:hypothetical protein